MLTAMLLAASCSPNPRREMPDVIAAVAASFAHDGGAGTCIERLVVRWSPSDGGDHMAETKPPPGFVDLTKVAPFLGGGGIGGASVSGVTIGGSVGCVRLRGPVIDRDRAMVAAERSSMLAGYWLRKRQGAWVVVGRTGTIGG